MRPGLINSGSNCSYLLEVTIIIRPGVSRIPSHRFKISSNVIFGLKHSEFNSSLPFFISVIIFNISSVSLFFKMLKIFISLLSSFVISLLNTKSPIQSISSNTIILLLNDIDPFSLYSL